MSRDNGPADFPRRYHGHSMMLESFRLRNVPDLGYEMQQMFASDDMSFGEAMSFVDDRSNWSWQPRLVDDVDDAVLDTFEQAFETLDMEDMEYDPRNDPDLPGWGTAIQWSDLHHLTISYEFAD